MFAKAVIGTAGAAAVALTASFSVPHDEQMAPVVGKGDRLAVAVSACVPNCTELATTKPAGRWITIERRF